MATRTLQLQTDTTGLFPAVLILVALLLAVLGVAAHAAFA